MVSEKFIRNQISLFSHKPQLQDRSSCLKVWIFQDHSFDEGKNHEQFVQKKHEYTNVVKIQDYCGIKDGLSVLFFVFYKVSNNRFQTTGLLIHLPWIIWTFPFARREWHRQANWVLFE